MSPIRSEKTNLGKHRAEGPHQIKPNIDAGDASSLTPPTPISHPPPFTWKPRNLSKDVERDAEGVKGVLYANKTKKILLNVAYRRVKQTQSRSTQYARKCSGANKRLQAAC